MNFTRKGYTDDSLLQHPTLQSVPYKTTLEKLTQAGITSYTKLFEVITGVNADSELRATACWTIRAVIETLDKRKILKPLLTALNSNEENVRGGALDSLAYLKNKYVSTRLVKIICNSQEYYTVRLSAIHRLDSNLRSTYFTELRNVIFDEADDIRVRCEVLEWLSYPSDFNEIDDFIQLLQHSSPDLRFWAAYRLSQSNTDITPAVTVLDKVAAFDHHLPVTWGWHIDREALEALESAYWLKMGLKRRHWPPSMYLISPAPEYSTFEWLFRKYQQDEFYKQFAEPKVTLKLKPDWLAEKLRAKWPKIQFDIREPKPQTYLLNWLIKINNSPLMGGLHRDQYSVALTGSTKAVQTFAAWYRSIIEPEQYLYLYEWAGLAVELKPGINAEGVEKAQRQREKHMNAVYERSINYPWVTETE